MLKYIRKHNSEKTYKSLKTNTSISHDFANYVIIPDKILDEKHFSFGIQRNMTLNLLPCILLRIWYPDLEHNITTRFTDHYFVSSLVIYFSSSFIRPVPIKNYLATLLVILDI